MKKFAFLIFLILLAIVVYGQYIGGQELTTSFTKPTLESAVEQQLDKSEGRYGIYIKNLKTNEVYKSFENQQFDSGSLYKLWLMVAVFEQIKNGQLNEDQELKQDVAVLNKMFNIASDEAELKEGQIILTVKQALEQMIVISHNYAALLLTNEVGGFKIPEKTTASDLALYFEKLYKGEIIDKQYSQRMLDILSRQKVSDRISKYLPERTIVAHKTGDIGFSEHDAGIVFSHKADFIIVVLSESDFPPAASENIAQISKAVYEYFNKER